MKRYKESFKMVEEDIDYEYPKEFEKKIKK